jgi:hypothetical protein
MENDPHGDAQWPPAETPAGSPHDGEQPDANSEAPIGDRLGRDPANLGNDVPVGGGDVVYPPVEAPAPHM